MLLCYPHTSNWDLLFLKAAAWHYGLEISWLGKQELFWPPLGTFLRALGGLAVDRGGSGLVERLTKTFAARETLILCIPPEGTRRLVGEWRSGFYHIARAAGVPLQLSKLDYGRRRIEVSAPFDLTGNVSADMDSIRAFYAGSTGRHPEKSGAIRLKEEALAPRD